MHENEVNKRLWGRVEEIQSEGTFVIIRAIIDDGSGSGSGREEGEGRQVGVLVPKTSNRLYKIQSRSGKSNEGRTLLSPAFISGLFMNLPYCFGMFSLISPEVG